MGAAGPRNPRSQLGLIQHGRGRSSGAEVRVSEATGRRVRAETLSQEALRDSLRATGLGDKQVKDLAGMSAVMREDFTAEDKRSIVTTTPTTLAAWAHAYLRPALLGTAR